MWMNLKLLFELHNWSKLTEIIIHSIPGVYNVEPLKDFNWAIFSYCLNLLYHFIILQVIAIVSILFKLVFIIMYAPSQTHNNVLKYFMFQPAQVNLNHMLCPAILDPFEGPWYRVAAVLHQALLCPLLCKLYCIIADYCLTRFPLTKVKLQMKDNLTDKIVALKEKLFANEHKD